MRVVYRRSMRNFIGDIFDDIGCFFARYDFDSLASCFSRLAERTDPTRMEVADEGR
jgi:hypothetical protein